MAEKKVKPETAPAPEAAEALTSHYQKTFEVAYEYWKERNKLFVFLVLTAGIGLMLLLRVPTADTLIVDAIAKFLDISDEAYKAELYDAFPFDILLSGVMVVMFYLMQRLYSTNLSVMRNFMYLGAMEKEIRSHLRLPAGSVSFTREGDFYWGRRTFMQSMSKYYYSVVLFILLIPFIAFKLMADFQAPHPIVIIADMAVSVMTFLYWWEYVRSSFTLDKPKIEKQK